MMGVYKAKGSKTYSIDYTPKNGKRIREATKFTNKKDAEEYLKQRKSEQWRVNELNEKPRHTWEETVLKYCEIKSQLKGYQKILREIRYLSKHLDNKFIDTIDEELINNIKEIRSNDIDRRFKNQKLKISDTTVNSTLSALGAILNFACSNLKWIEQVPAIVMIETRTNRIPRNYLSKDQAKLLISEMASPMQEMTEFSLATGLRKSNMLDLKWSQIDLEKKNAWIPADKSKNGYAIYVPLNDWSIKVLKSQSGKHKIYVFCNENGKHCKTVPPRTWRKALDRAGITQYLPSESNKCQGYPTKTKEEYSYDDFTWHDLRHTWASWHIQAGTPLPILKELGGWSSYKTVLRYAHLSNNYISNFANNVSPV